jgi:hypothetical protein
MIDDFKPASRPAKSLRTALDNISESPAAPATAPEESEFFQAPEGSAQSEVEQVPEEQPADTEQTTSDQTEQNASEVSQPEPAKTESEPKPEKPKGWTRHLRKKWVIITAAVIVVVGGSAAAWFMLHSTPKPTPLKKLSIVQIKAPAPTTVASDLSGLQVAPSINNLPVTAVMIENSTFARPQSGLGQASVVFEALAEGGITRFMALYQDTAPSNVGPIRSVRPYYIQWAMGFDAAIAHVGGSPDALSDITAWNTRDLNEFYNGSYYHRITSREAPHNVYTSISLLNQLEDSKGYNTSTYTGFLRKDADPAKQPTAAVINMDLSSSDYNVEYEYDAATNSYNRSEGGAPQIDANTNAQISPKVVVAMIIPESDGALDSSGAYYSVYQDIGSGPVDIFQDGTVTTGQWTKNSNTAQITFTTAKGAPIKLDPGQTWLTALATSSELTYKP